MQDKPSGWPGITWIEGRTVLQVPNVEGQAEWRVGPANKSDSPVFHNVAMANNRTRSVLLLGLAILGSFICMAIITRRTFKTSFKLLSTTLVVITSVTLVG